VPSISSIPAFEVEIQQTSEYGDSLLCLDIPNGVSEYVNLQGFPRHGRRNQRWKLNFVDQLFCMIYSPLNDWIVTVPNGRVGYVPVQQNPPPQVTYPGETNFNQQWLLRWIQSPIELPNFQPSALEICTRLDRAWKLTFNSDQENRCELTDRGRTGFQFVVHPLQEGIWIINGASRRYVDVPNSRTDNDSPVQQFPLDVPYQNNQLWQFESIGDQGYSLIRNVNSRKCLTAEHLDFGNPVRVVQHDETRSDLQKWKPVLMSNGTVQLRSPQDRCLGIMANGSWLEAQSATGADSQCWHLDRVHADL